MPKGRAARKPLSAAQVQKETKQVQKLVKEVKKERRRARFDKKAAYQITTPAAYGQFMERTRYNDVPTRSQRINMDNAYLRMLIDPIGCIPNSYPDEFEGMSACFKTVVNSNPGYGTSDLSSGGATWPKGKYHFVVVPDLENPLRAISQASIAIDGTASLVKNDINGFICPIRNIDHPKVKPQMPADEALQMQPNIFYNVAVNYACTATTGSSIAYEQWTFHGIDSSSNEFFGIPFDASASSICQVTVNIASTGGATTFGVATCDSGGVGTEQTVAVTNPGPYTVAVSQANQRTANAIPGMGIRIRVAGGTSVALMSNISIKLLSANGQKNAWFRGSIPDSETASLLLQQYRTVSQAFLLSYRGPTLNNAGRSACYAYRGGYGPGWMDFHDYDALTEIVGVQDNEVIKGSYAYWQPADTKAMQFRSLDKPLLQFPYLVATGFYLGDGASSPQPNMLRLRIATNIEAITTNQIIPVRPSRIDVRNEKERALAYLKGFPQVMENPLHWAAIADVLKGAIKKTFSTAKAAHDFYQKNRSWIDPAVTAGTTALMAL
jgi:hypothetical protein